MAMVPRVCNFGEKASPFELPATDGRVLRLADIAGRKGTVIVFLCNHCPYVKAIIDRLIRDARDLEPLGVRMAAICSNDAAAYPEDGFEEMRRWAREKEFPFPYLHDASQEVARAYGAVCTPDFFGYDAGLGLQYRGRLDASRMAPVDGARRELFEAMRQVALTGCGPEEQSPSMGCSIKWKAG
ncbi:thioredoxin family protein [Geminicoccaceae bacterium 1502E]|nr:thioredoxin family protein [Geminicoccaceae bacterium 1502E]